MEAQLKGDPKRYQRDETGQWWYLYGSKRIRTRVYPMTCPSCGVQFIPPYRSISQRSACCSKTCGQRIYFANNPGVRVREKSGRWRGGKYKNRNGYVLAYAPDHPNCQGNTRLYVLEHRLVMEQHLGRYLHKHETVHHKNGIRHDNRIENLELWAGAHPKGARNDEIKHCPTCTCSAH